MINISSKPGSTRRICMAVVGVAAVRQGGSVAIKLNVDIIWVEGTTYITANVLSYFYEPRNVSLCTGWCLKWSECLNVSLQTI